MLILAVCELDMTPEYFWELSWYDWGLYILKYNTKVERERDKEEAHWVRTRAFMALFANAHRDKKKRPTEFKPTDFIVLSFDKTEAPKKIVSEKEMKQKFGGKFKKDGK